MATSSPPPESSQRPLNPEMVYAPLTPRDSTDGLVGNDDDSDDHTPTFRIPLSCRLPASLVTVLRATVLVFSFVDCIFWAEELTYSSVYRRLIFISLLFLTLWTLSLLGYNRSVSKHLCRGGGGGRFSCQIGPLRCILGDSDDDYDEDNGDEPPKERKVFRLSWAVDLTFAIMLLVLGILQQIDGRISWKYHSHDYPRYFVLLYMVVSLEFVIAFWTFLSVLPVRIKSVALTVHASRSAVPSYRIRLPQEGDAPAARGKQISVQA